MSRYPSFFRFTFVTLGVAVLFAVAPRHSATAFADDPDPSPTDTSTPAPGPTDTSTPAPDPTQSTIPNPTHSGCTDAKNLTSTQTDYYVPSYGVANAKADVLAKVMQDLANQKAAFAPICAAKGCSVYFAEPVSIPDQSGDPVVTGGGGRQCVDVPTPSYGAPLSSPPVTNWDDILAHNSAFTIAQRAGQTSVALADNYQGCHNPTFPNVVVELNYWVPGSYTADCHESSGWAQPYQWQCSGFLWQHIQCCSNDATFNVSRSKAVRANCY